MQAISAGFTGTREGQTEEQKKTFIKVIKHLELREFRHGDCLGADQEADGMVKLIYGKDVSIIIHPPIKEDARAFCTADLILAPKDYLDRDREIVNSTDILIATPKSMEKQSGGTWYTIRYADQKQRDIYLIRPDGECIRYYTARHMQVMSF